MCVICSLFRHGLLFVASCSKRARLPGALPVILIRFPDNWSTPVIWNGTAFLRTCLDNLLLSASDVDWARPEFDPSLGDVGELEPKFTTVFLLADASLKQVDSVADVLPILKVLHGQNAPHDPRVHPDSLTAKLTVQAYVLFLSVS